MQRKLAFEAVPGSPSAVALGLALAARFSECQDLMERRIQAVDGANPVLPEEFRHREHLTRQFASALIGRWLVTGASASEDEARWISEQGKVAAAAGLSIAAVAKHYLNWRDSLIAFLQRLGTELDTPTEVLGAVEHVIRASADASIMRLIRDYDEEVRRLRQLLHAEQSNLRHQALHDQLTGVPNRAYFYEQLAQALGTYRREQVGFSLLLLDLDHFKEINDSLGHQIGDVVLRHVTAQLRPNLREGDTLARWGGDEFGIVLPGANLQQAIGIAGRLKKSLETPVRAEGMALSAQASIGIASCPQHGVDGETLLRHADVALYQAKRAAKGIWVYETGDVSDLEVSA